MTKSEISPEEAIETLRVTLGKFAEFISIAFEETRGSRSFMILDRRTGRWFKITPMPPEGEEELIADGCSIDSSLKAPGGPKVG